MPINQNIDLLQVDDYCDKILAEAYLCEVEFRKSGSFEKSMVSSVWIYAKYNMDAELGDYCVMQLKEQELMSAYFKCTKQGDFYHLRITKAGISFHNTTSFKEERERNNLLQEAENTNLEKTKIDVKLSKWLLKTKWWPHAIALISAAWAVFVFIDAKSDSRIQQSQIIDLEKKLQETRNEIYIRLDSLSRKAHNADTGTKK